MPGPVEPDISSCPTWDEFENKLKDALPQDTVDTMTETCGRVWNFQPHHVSIITGVLTIAMLLTDILYLTELFVHDEKYLLGMHTTRIIIFLSMILMSVIMLALKHKTGGINAIFDLVVKFITFGILTGYTATMYTRYKDVPDTEKSIMQLLVVIGGLVFTLLVLGFFLWGLKKYFYNKESMAYLSQWQFILWALFGIALSVVSIFKIKLPDICHKYYCKEEDKPTTPSASIPNPTTD